MSDHTDDAVVTTEPEPTPPATATPNRRRTIMIGSVIAGVVVIGGIIAAVVAANADHGPDFAAALETCKITPGTYARVLDGGDGLVLDGQGEDTPGLRLESIACVLTDLGVPGTTINRMDSTRALDGRQSDTLDDFTVEWSYHPDDGLDLLFSK